MAEIKPRPPQQEIYVGMSQYMSSSEGIGGKLKQSPEDFMVQEITEDGKTLSFEEDVEGDTLPGDYVHFTLVKKNWDTMRAVKEIARRLGISQNRISFAGTKDKHAITSQRVSAKGASIEDLKKVNLGDITLKDFSYADEDVGMGSLWGNRFTVTVDGVCEDAADRIEDIGGQLRAGFPNYYGMQRFGQLRPITHEVGLHIIGGDLEEAVLTYLAKSFPEEDDEIRGVRGELASTQDYKKALKDFPDHLGYEKALLNHLAEREGDYRGAINRLPRNLQRMFVHAYQSYVFNRALSECISQGHLVERLPLPGVRVEADPISRRFLEEDGIAESDFYVRGLPGVRSNGSYRQCYQSAIDFGFCVEGEKATFQFSLKSGTYATVLLREYMKNQV